MVTEVRIEQAGRGNSAVLDRKEKEDKDGAERGLPGISFVPSFCSPYLLIPLT